MSKVLKIVIAVVVVAAVGCGVYFGFFNKPAAAPVVDAEPAVVEAVEQTEEESPEMAEETTAPEANG